MNSTLDTNASGPKARVSAALVISAAFALLALPCIAAAQAVQAAQAQRTAHYTLELAIGDAEMMISPMDAKPAQNGEVMVNGGTMMATGQSMAPGAGMGMPGMATGESMATPRVDQGMPVNHHLEVRITLNDTGSVVGNVTPTIRVTNKSTGATRDLPQVMAMYGVQAGPADIHYGQNVFLPDGTYQVTVTVGSDTATFRDLLVSGGAPMMPSMSMGAGATTPNASMPGMSSDAVARDGQTLADQPSAVQTLFMATWANRAPQEWATEHNASLMKP